MKKRLKSLFSLAFISVLPAGVAAQTPAEMYRQQQQYETKKQSQASALSKLCENAITGNRFEVYIEDKNFDTRYIVFPYNSKTSVIDGPNSDKKVLYKYYPSTKECSRRAVLGEVKITASQECKTFIRTVPIMGSYQNIEVYWNPFTKEQQWVQEDNNKTLALYKTTKVGSCPQYILDSHRQDIHLSSWGNSFSSGTKTEKLSYEAAKSMLAVQFPYLPDVRWGNLPGNYLHASVLEIPKESGIDGYLGYVHEQNEPGDDIAVYHWINKTRSSLMTIDCAKNTTYMKGIYISEDDGKIYSEDHTAKKLWGTSAGNHFFKKICRVIVGKNSKEIFEIK